MLTPAAGPAVAAAYGLGSHAVLSAPARGETGRVWRLDTDRGTWAVKEWFGPQSLEELAAIGTFQEYLSARGGPLPRIVLDGSGANLRHIDDVLVRVYEWVDLAEPDSLLDPAAVGAAVAGLHRAPFRAVGTPHPWHTEPLGKDRWLELARLSAERSAPFADKLAAGVADLIAVEKVLQPMRPEQLCHLDLWADNLRQTVGGEICVIDWDQSGPADPRREVAMVLFEFGRTDAVRLKALQSAYIDAGGPAPVREAADFSVAIAQFGHICERHLTMWLAPDATDEGKQRAVRGVDEILDDPLDLATIATILDALN